MRGDRTAGLMVETLSEGLARLRGRPTRFSEVLRELCFKTSSFWTERWRVRLDGGEWLAVFFKDLDPRHQSEAVQTVRRGQRQRSDCELLMYRQVLSRERFGTPELYAFRWDPSSDLYWIFLEDVGDVRLNNVEDFDLWVAAARWAARFHAATSHLPAAQTAFLPRYDRDHYQQCAERVAKKLQDLHTLDRAVIRQALDVYEGTVNRLVELPQCVIHGEFFGKNNVIRRQSSAQAIAVVDWETAAIGPSYLDLVSLTTGRWNGQQRQAMWRAYFDQYQADTGLSLSWEGFCQDLGAVALYHALRWLGWRPDWNFSHGIARWVNELVWAIPTGCPAS